MSQPKSSKSQPNDQLKELGGQFKELGAISIGHKKRQGGLRINKRGLLATLKVRSKLKGTDKWIFFPFYRSLSPIEAAAQKGGLILP